VELLDGQLGSRTPSRRPQLDVGVGVGVAALGSPFGSEDDEAEIAAAELLGHEGSRRLSRSPQSTELVGAGVADDDSWRRLRELDLGPLGLLDGVDEAPCLLLAVVGGSVGATEDVWWFRLADEACVLDWQLESRRCCTMLHDDDAAPAPLGSSVGVLEGGVVKWWLLLLIDELAEHPGSSGEQSDEESGDTRGSRFDDEGDIGVSLEDDASVWFLPFVPAPKPAILPSALLFTNERLACECEDDCDASAESRVIKARVQKRQIYK